MTKITIDRSTVEQALEALEGKRFTACGWRTDCDVAITALKAALAEPVQEPVAWRTFDGEGGYDYRTYEDNEDYAAEWAKRNPRHVGWVEPVYTAPPQRPAQPVQEPYAWMAVGGTVWRHKSSQDDVPLYTDPPQRKPLSGIQVERLLEQVIGSLPVARNLIRAVEAAHGIKEEK